jgi:hypothetical protein
MRCGAVVYEAERAVKRGRPRTPPEIREALETATPKALARLIELMDDMDPRVQMTAEGMKRVWRAGPPPSSRNRVMKT